MASLATKNLIPKSSTAKVKVVVRVEWVQRLGCVSVGLEVAYKAFVGNDDGLLDSVHPLPF